MSRSSVYHTMKSNNKQLGCHRAYRITNKTQDQTSQLYLHIIAGIRTCKTLISHVNITSILRSYYWHESYTHTSMNAFIQSMQIFTHIRKCNNWQNVKDDIALTVWNSVSKTNFNSSVNHDQKVRWIYYRGF